MQVSIRNARLVMAALGAIFFATLASAQSKTAAPATCPIFSSGWQEGLITYTLKGAAFPTQDTAPSKFKTLPESQHGCVFQQWAAEAFVWATAINATTGQPRFMGLKTVDQLLPSGPTSATKSVQTTGGAGLLKLGLRQHPTGAGANLQAATAIVQADGNIQIAQNGYPVYASVHMNGSYFTTAQKNLIKTGGYSKQPSDSYFNVGAAVFKATWLRVDDASQIPSGAYTTQALVPVLTTYPASANQKTPYIAPAVDQNGQTRTVQATVALVGLHVVGYTVDHPEFVWATYEHKLNAPRFVDGTFPTSMPASGASNPNNFTLYAANTPYSQVNVPNPAQGNPPTTPTGAAPLNLNATTQKFGPVSNTVQQNKTGAASFPSVAQGVSDIVAINQSTQSFLASLKTKQHHFSNYDLIGTVWLQPGAYAKGTPALLNNQNLQSSAVGSLNLANSTAETYQQVNSTTSVQNCFSCHNPQSFNGQFAPKSYPLRRIAISHALAAGSVDAVPNLVPLPAATVAAAAAALSAPTGAAASK